MPYQETSFLMWIVFFTQITGLASSWLARIAEGSRSQAACQWFFLACLALTGLTTMAAVDLGPRYWLISATTLSVMILGAVWDFRPQPGRESI